MLEEKWLWLRKENLSDLDGHIRHNVIDPVWVNLHSVDFYSNRKLTEILACFAFCEVDTSRSDCSVAPTFFLARFTVVEAAEVGLKDFWPWFLSVCRL
jgi:hypothetical protein